MAMSEVSLNLIIRASDLASEVLDGLIDNLQGVADAVSDVIAADAATMQELLAQMGQFRDAATAANLDMTNLNANLAGTTDQATDSVNELVPAVGTAGTEVGAFGEVVADTASPLGALSADLALAEAGSISLGEGADTAQEAIEGVNEQTTTVAASVDALGVSMDTAATQTDAAMDSITAGVDGAVTSMDGLATGTDAAATSMAEGITAGVDTATISLDDLQTQVNAAVANFMALGTEATAAGDELAAGVTAGATDADAALDSMGATADTVGTEVDVSLDSIAASATATRDTLAGLGGSFSNVLMGAMAIGGGVMGLDALTGHAATTAESIAQVGAATGLTANQSTQLLAAFAAVGDNAQTATQMIQMLDKNLTSMSTTTIKQMNEFGVAVKDATGNALPLPDILNNVAAAYQTLGAQKGTEMLETIFGRSAVTLAPLIDGWTQISGLVSGIKSPFGDDTATKAYDADVIKLHTDMFQVSLDIAKIGEDITPAMEKVAKGLEDVLNDLTGGKGVIQAFEDWSKDIGAVGTAITGLSVGVAIIEGISIATKLAKDAQEAWAGIMLATNWVAFGIEMTALSIAEGAVATATWLWTAAQTALDFVLSPMALVILGVVVALAALAVGVYEVIEHWSTIRTFFENLWTDIKTDATAIWTDIKTWFETNWNAISTDATDVWDDIKSFFENIWNGIKTDATTIWDDITGALETAWNDIVSASDAAWNDFKNTIQEVWTWIVQEVQSAVNTVMNLINSIINAVESAINAIKNLMGMGGGGGSSNSSVNVSLGTHAEGGIATQATAGIFGEAEDEALIPLDSPTGQGMLGDAFGGGGAYFGGGGGSSQTVINIQCSGNVTSSEEALAQVIMQRIMERVNLLGGNLDPGWATGR